METPLIDPFRAWVAGAMAEEDAAVPDSPEELAGYLTRFNTEIAAIAPAFDDITLARGVWYLYGCGSSTIAEIARLAPGPVTRAFFASVRLLCQDLFAVRCTPFCSHLNTGGESARHFHPLNAPCYMLWDMNGMDIFTVSPHPEHRESCLRLLEELTRPPHPAVVESAIHGLGHMMDDPADACGRVLQPLTIRPDLPETVRVYARNALDGRIQ